MCDENFRGGLTVFETFFQERRPFFVEGANLFSFPSAAFAAPQLFYSRRVGRAPTGPIPAGAAFSDRPEVSTILGAVKLSGQVGGWSVGAMNASTARETAGYFIDAARQGRAAVEPATNYSVLSLRRDFRRGASGMGFIGTNVARQIDTSSLTFLRSSAQAGGFDVFHRFGGNRYSINATVAASSLHGDSTSIIAAQRYSIRGSDRCRATTSRSRAEKWRACGSSTLTSLRLRRDSRSTTSASSQRPTASFTAFG